MLAVAFIGVIMHELTSGQVQALVTAAKTVAGENAVLVCNASGLFASAPRLGQQLELLFDSEIDLVFAGEQAIARNAGRSELQNVQRSILRPENFSSGAPGIGTKLLASGPDKIWMICLAEQSFKTPLEHAHEVLEVFFRNKKDTFPVFINVNGKDPDYKKALYWKYGKENGSVTIVGSGMNCCTGKARLSSTGSAFLADAGVVASEDSISGMAPELWWKRNIGRLPIAVLPGNGRIEADFSVFFYENGRAVKSITEKLLV